MPCMIELDVIKKRFLNMLKGVLNSFRYQHIKTAKQSKH